MGEWDGDNDPSERLGGGGSEDRYVASAKPQLLAFINANPDAVFFERQLQTRFERGYFHWISSRALRELVAEGQIKSETLPLHFPGARGATMRFFFAKGLRYWSRKAKTSVELVRRYSDSEFNRAIGRHAEMLFDSALASVGFTVAAKEAREFRGVAWSETGHNLVGFMSVTASLTEPK